MSKLTDTELLDHLESGCLDLRCHSAPTGGGDADVMWTVIEHHMAPPKERQVGHPAMTVREAITSAIEAEADSINREVQREQRQRY